MLVLKHAFAVVGTALIVSGCSIGDAMWPSLTGDDPVPAQTAVAPVPESAPVNRPVPQPVQTTAQQAVAQVAQAAPLSGAGPTGTYVGAQVRTLQSDVNRLKTAIANHSQELQGLRARTVGHSQAYHRTVAEVNASLQVGTTPGNPVLVQKWNTAQGQLDRVNDEIAKLNELATRVANDSSLSAFLLDQVRSAYQVSGAVDEDHRQLDLLADDVNRTVVLVDRLLSEISDDLRRQTTYVSGERGNLNTLSLAIKNGELFGAALNKRSFAAAGLDAAAQAQPRRTVAPASVANARPLVVIKFDRPNVRYEQALYTAVSRVLERRPEANFAVVAVAPARGTPAEISRASSEAKRNAEDVLRSLSDMGLPSNRVAVSSSTSNSASSNEVHLFVR